uniref:Transmembrane p24 trafficking protein 4 n=1 Tax=Cairina moschata TaxID=8855 RepID=A0A8C3CJP6_CAIMO
GAAGGGACAVAMAGGGGLRAAVAALVLAAWGAHGLYFHIGETEKRCFIEEIPDETMVIGAGRRGGHRGIWGGWGGSGRVHQICLHSNSTRMALFAGGKLRVHLDIQVGEHTNNYPEIAAKDKLTELQLRARQLLDQVEQIQKEQNYQRYREERFRMTSESTNQRVLWWSIAQTGILILTGIWQMRHLKSFFEAKKLV